MFQFSHISKSFQNTSNQKKQVLQDISFEIPEKKIISLIGPSGCGKTTFLRILAGFDTQFSGDLLYYSNSNNKFEPFHPLGKVGYISQENSLFPWLTVEDNIRFGLKIHNISKIEQNRIVDDLLALVGLTAFRKYYPKEISGGMKQKVVICRALAINPISNFILMDEPFSSLDAQTRNAIQVDLIDIWRRRNLTILFVTHNIDEAVFLSNTVHVMSSAPASIIRSVDILLSHPRDRTSSEFNQIRKQLLELLHVF